MKLRILKNCHDKFTGEEYVVGKEYDFTKERAEGILKNKPGFASLVEEPKEKEVTETTEKKPVKTSKKKSK